jgi:hypothetical protein
MGECFQLGRYGARGGRGGNSRAVLFVFEMGPLLATKIDGRKNFSAIFQEIVVFLQGLNPDI